MTKMRAIVAERPGGPDRLVLREVERPTPDLTEILVRVRAAGVNPTDWKQLADGELGGRKIPGYDVAGVVEAVGPGVTLYHSGEEVLGMPMFPHLPGAYAEYVVTPARHFAPKPASLSFEEAGGLPLAALTAWQGLVDTGKLRAGQRVLIHAAAGGVGHLAVQIAKSLGAYVIGTASAAKHEFVRGLGADEVIDYRAADFVDVLRDRPVDVVFDPIAGEYSSRSLRMLRDGGVLVSILPVDEAAMKEAAARGIPTGFTLVEPDRLALTAIVDLVERGELRVEIDSVFALENAIEALRRSETGRVVGKIVLRVAEG